MKWGEGQGELSDCSATLTLSEEEREEGLGKVLWTALQGKEGSEKPSGTQ